MTRNGFSHCHILYAFSDVLSPLSSVDRLTWIVSGWAKKHKTTAVPAKAVCSQKMSRQLRKVTMIPPMKGPCQVSVLHVELEDQKLT